MSTIPGSDGTDPTPTEHEIVEPTRRERLRPVEFIVMALIIAVFIGLVVLGSTREVVLALVFFGVGFIVSLVVIAMLALAVKPDDAEQQDLDEQNHEHGGSTH
ncbi:hypothetical protein [Lacisediminihabitans changchengi]|uniref:hypothetical protein n=1 Tax=Lacisediminihabitans changchengi TaxID=2787634 RepID=UPI0027DD66FB|nr:hypothetical protein [Lacisediminihabitans changchengi]